MHDSDTPIPEKEPATLKDSESSNTEYSSTAEMIAPRLAPPEHEALKAELYQQPDQDDLEYAFHLAVLNDDLLYLRDKKLKATYAAEENRTAELEPIYQRLEYIDEFFKQKPDNCEPADHSAKAGGSTTTETVTPAPAAAAASPQQQIPTPKRSDELTEAMVNVANRYLENRQPVPPWQDLWNHFLDMVGRDPLLGELNATHNQRTDGCINYEQRNGKPATCNRRQFRRRYLHNIKKAE